MDLPTMTTAVRQDLNDTDSTNYRWIDTIIQRQIDRAVDRYSTVAPLIKKTQISTLALNRLYQFPANAWWIERVEYPIGRRPPRYNPWFEYTSAQIADPIASALWLTGIPALAATPSPGGGSLSAGTYQYAYTWVTPGGETLTSAIASATATAGGSVTLANIPSGPYGVVAINLYRTTVGATQLKYLTQLPNNSSAAIPQGAANTSTQSYTDTAADASLGANAPTANTTAGVQIFEMQLEQSLLPTDNTGIIEVTAAYKHQLDNSGCTIPERHWDAISLGAEAYLCWQYVTAVNDNFDYVDGQFRDRVDDTKSAVAWRMQATDTMQRFNHRITEIQNQATANLHSYPQWGDKPVRWDRI